MQEELEEKITPEVTVVLLGLSVLLQTLGPQSFIEGWSCSVRYGEGADWGKELRSSGLQKPQLYNNSALGNTMRSEKKKKKDLEECVATRVSILVSHYYTLFTLLPHGLALSPGKPIHISTLLMVMGDFQFWFWQPRMFLASWNHSPSLLAVEREEGSSGSCLKPSQGLGVKSPCASVWHGRLSTTRALPTWLISTILCSATSNFL